MGINGHLFMVSANCMKPRLAQNPLINIDRLWASVNQIADTEQTVNGRIEAGRIQSGLQPGEVAMNVTYRKVMA